MLRFAQHDNCMDSRHHHLDDPHCHRWARWPLTGWEAVDTMRVNRVMMFVIHTQPLTDPGCYISSSRRGGGLDSRYECRSLDKSGTYARTEAHGTLFATCVRGRMPASRGGETWRRIHTRYDGDHLFTSRTRARRAAIKAPHHPTPPLMIFDNRMR